MLQLIYLTILQFYYLADGIKNSAGNTSSKGCAACIIKPQALCAQTNNRPINYYRYRTRCPTCNEANYRTCYQATQRYIDIGLLTYDNWRKALYLKFGAKLLLLF